MSSPASPDAAPDQVLSILQASATFKDVQAEDLEGLTPAVVQQPSGTTLFRQGDPADVAYVVARGLLGLYAATQPERDERPFRRVVAGEVVGEYGLLSDQPRSATAVTLSDCTLLRLERALLERILARRPRIQASLLRQIAAAASRGRGSGRMPVRTVALLDRQPGSEVTRMAIGQLKAELDRRSGDRDCQGLRIELLRAGDEEHCHRQLIAAAAGSGITVLLLEQPEVLSERNCQLIDRLATIEAGPSGLQSQPSPEIPAAAGVDLAVHLWPPTLDRPRQGQAVCRRHDGPQDLHIRPERPGEIGRLARMLLGHPTVLVLGGGGARGFAHIGVIAALEQLGQPAIDMVLGVSVGSLVGCLRAFDLSAAQILCELERVIIRSRPYGFKLPTDALFSLENSRRALQQFFGNACLEDAWLPFRAYSANLSRKRLQSWQRGNIADAVIASMSVPGIFPACRDRQGDLHVDGGILCNLPISEARRLTDGRVIAISLDALPGEAGGESGASRQPSLAGTIINAMMCGSHAEGLSQAAEADLLLRPEISAYSFLDWKQYRQIHEAGYREGLRMLGPAAGDAIGTSDLTSADSERRSR